MEMAVILVVIFVTVANAQPTYVCRPDETESCSAQQATGERHAILDLLSGLTTVVNQVQLQLDAIVTSTNESTARLNALDAPYMCETEAQFLQHEGHEYLLGLEAVTWEEARDRCHRCGYGLVRTESVAERNGILQWLTAIGVDNIPGPGGYVWVDGTDQGHEGCWIWTHPVVTLMNTTFQDWRPGQPDNYEGAEHCNSVKTTQGQWNDLPCNMMCGFICKRAQGVLRSRMPSMAEVRSPSVC